MSKEEIVKVLDDYGVLSTFKPKEGETIFFTINPFKINTEDALEWMKIISHVYPKHQVIVKLDGMTLESLLEDDLK